MGLLDHTTKKPWRDDDQRELHLRWLTEIQQSGVNLTVKEEDFIESIDERLSTGRSLTESQAEWLEDIYSKRTP